MKKPAKAVKSPARAERRVLRSSDLCRALHYQLDHCRGEAELEAMIVSDESGLCLASVGERATCDEIAAELPIIGRKTHEFEGVLLSPVGGRRVSIRRFHVGSDELYLCAVGGDEARVPAQIARSVSGVSRILSAA